MDFDELIDKWGNKLCQFDDKKIEIEQKQEAGDSLDPSEEIFLETYEEIESRIKQAEEQNDENMEVDEFLIEEINRLFERITRER